MADKRTKASLCRARWVVSKVEKISSQAEQDVEQARACTPSTKYVTERQGAGLRQVQRSQCPSAPGKENLQVQLRHVLSLQSHAFFWIVALSSLSAARLWFAVGGDEREGMVWWSLQFWGFDDTHRLLQKWGTMGGGETLQGQYWWWGLTPPAPHSHLVLGRVLLSPEAVVDRSFLAPIQQCLPILHSGRLFLFTQASLSRVTT